VDWSFLVTPEFLLSWPVGVTLFVISAIALFADPDPEQEVAYNVRHLTCTFVWPLFLFWIIAKFIPM
jgi:hypothetical protein